MPALLLALLSVLACVAVTSADVNEAQALQEDIIMDVAQLAKMSPKPVPSLLEAAIASGFQPMPVGSLVTRKFGTVDELKKTGPVKKVKGKLMGGPFTMAQAVRAAGLELIKKIFPRAASSYAEDDGPGAAAPKAEPQPESPDKEKAAYKAQAPAGQAPPKHESLLVGKLLASLNSKEEFMSKWKPKLNNQKVGEVKGKVIARDKDIMKSSYVKSPADVLAKLDYAPKIIDGQILAGDTNGIEMLSEEQVQAKIKGKGN